jgi:hypothetical protein
MVRCCFLKKTRTAFPARASRWRLPFPPHVLAVFQHKALRGTRACPPTPSLARTERNGRSASPRPLVSAWSGLARLRSDKRARPADRGDSASIHVPSRSSLPPHQSPSPPFPRPHYGLDSPELTRRRRTTGLLPHPRRARSSRLTGPPRLRASLAVAAAPLLLLASAPPGRFVAMAVVLLLLRLAGGITEEVLRDARFLAVELGDLAGWLVAWFGFSKPERRGDGVLPVHGQAAAPWLRGPRAPRLPDSL